MSLKKADLITFIRFLIEIPFFSKGRKSYESRKNGIPVQYRHQCYHKVYFHYLPGPTGGRLILGFLLVLCPQLDQDGVDSKKPAGKQKHRYMY